MPLAPRKDGTLHSPRVFKGRYRVFVREAILNPGAYIHVCGAISKSAGHHRQAELNYLIKCIRRFPGDWPEIGARIQDWVFDTKCRDMPFQLRGEGSFAGVRAPDFEVVLRAKLDGYDWRAIAAQVPPQK